MFLAHLHQGRPDGLVAVRVVLHGVAHDVCHLVETAILQLVHGVQDSALHGFQAVVNIRERSIQDDVGGVVEIPLAVHRLRENHFVQARIVMQLFVRILLRDNDIRSIFVNSFV